MRQDWKETQASPKMSSRRLPLAETIAAMDSGRRKRVWTALEEGNHLQAVKVLKEASITDDAEIEAYIQHLRDEEERQTLLMYESVRRDEEEEDIALLMDAMTFEDRHAVPCPVCFKGEILSLGETGQVSCSLCSFSMRWNETLEAFCDLLAGYFEMHARSCQVQRPKIEFSKESGLTFSCQSCQTCWRILS